MPGQFLLLPDGSVPPGTNVPALEAAGVVFARPTAPPVPPAGHEAYDTGDPEQVGGVWYQRWATRPVAPPPPVRQVPPLEFLDRLDMPTQAAVLAAAEQSLTAKLWVNRLLASTLVDLDAERTRAGVAALVAAGVLTQAQADALLA